MERRWGFGEVIVRQERLGLVPLAHLAPQPVEGVWLEVPVYIVDDVAEHLVSYIAPGAPFCFPDGDWPTPDGRHPWAANSGWSGNGMLMVQRPGEHHAVWHFWDGPDREFRGWYLNLQTAFERTPVGYATQDLELDVLVDTDGTITLKDDALLDQRVDEGRYTSELVDWIRAYGRRVIGDWTDGRSRIDPAWSEWAPPPHWTDPIFPEE